MSKAKKMKKGPKKQKDRDVRVLRTLGDYRRVAREKLYGPLPPPRDTHISLYDAINLPISRPIIDELGECVVGPEVTDCFLCFDKVCRVWNPPLFRSSQLVEFANAYKKEESVYELFPGWKRRPDVNALLFMLVGMS